MEFTAAASTQDSALQYVKEMKMEWELIKREKAEHLVYYLKGIAQHEAEMHQYQMTAMIRERVDEDNIPYEELTIRISFTNKS